MNLKKYFSLAILIVFIGLSVVLSTQVVNIYQTSQKRDTAKAEYYQSQKKYRNADSKMSEKDKTVLKIKLQDQRYTYKVLKYESCDFLSYEAGIGRIFAGLWFFFLLFNII